MFSRVSNFSPHINEFNPLELILVMVEVDSHPFACGYPVFPECFAEDFFSPLCVSASSGRVNRLKCLGLFLTLFHRLIHGGKVGGGRTWQKREHLAECVPKLSRASTCALCRALGELRGMVDRESGLFLITS